MAYAWRLLGGCSVLLWIALAAAANAQPAGNRFEEERRVANSNTVTIVSSSISSTYTRFVQDIQDVLDESGIPGGLRVLPVLGRGGGQNLHDILFLRSVDMGTTDVAFLEDFKQKDPVLYGNVAQRVHYVCKLLDSEFHLLAARDIKSYADLNGKKVSFWKERSITALGAERIFGMLGIEVEPVFMDNAAAIEAMKAGKISAIARMSGAPHNDYDGLKGDEGFHLLPLEETSVSADAYNKLLLAYLPAQLSDKHYPKLIPAGQVVPTVASSVVLAVYNWPEGSERYVKLANFVRKLFDNIHKFHDPARHPKWAEVNLAANVPGWTRFKAAQDWIDANVRAPRATQAGMEEAFEKFIQEYSIKTGAGQIARPEREQLFNEFQQWWWARRPGND